MAKDTGRISILDLKSIVDRYIDQMSALPRISDQAKLMSALDELEAWRAAHTTIPYTPATNDGDNDV